MHRNVAVTLLLSLTLASCSPSGPRAPAATVAERPALESTLQHFTSFQLDSVAQRPADTSGPARLLGDRGGYSYVLIRRTSPGEVEVHAAWDDVFVVRTGRGTLVTGSTAEGGRDTGPGERRGGRIPTPQQRTLGVGDVVIIPAGLAHQVIPNPGEPLTYLVVKASARAR